MNAALRPSPDEVEAQISAAEDWLSDSPTDYQRTRYGATIEALTWAQRGGPGPWTGHLYHHHDDQTIDSESWAAHAAEQTARANFDDSDRPGCIHEALQWFLGRGEEPVD